VHNILPPLILALMAFNAAAADCAFGAWGKYRDTNLYKHPSVSAYLFKTAYVKVDADGAPNAYHPDDLKLNCIKGVGFKGLDCPANAGYPNQSWWPSALYPDPYNPTRAYIQQPPSPYAGFFVSQTSLFDGAKAKNDPARYVDSRTVPYLVFPGKFNSMSGTGLMGDFGYALNIMTGKASPFIVAEVGPPNAEFGEMSIALATELGGKDPNPRTGAGAPQGKTIYVVFPRSRNASAWPLTNAQIAANAERLLENIGGLAVVEACKNTP